MRFNLGELFCGPGGIGYAAKNIKINKGKEEFSISHAWANDIDQDTCETYRLNISPENPESVLCSPVQDLDIEALPPIDALAFGFPCNDFSVVGEQNGINGSYGPLYSYGVKTLKTHEPKWFLAENVSGLQSANEGSTFKKILYELRKAGPGYKLTTHKYKFEEYGVPQSRHRIIIIGIRSDFSFDFDVPAPFTMKPELQLSVKECIENPPIPDNSPNNELTKHSHTVVERLKYIPPGENAWYEGIPEHLQLNVSKVRMSQIYRRLDPEKPSYTITGSGGGGTHVYHWSEPRALTNRERARIQTFPDDFIFIGGKESVRKQIGMAVPQEGAKVILTAVLKTFAGIEYESIPPNMNGIDLQQQEMELNYGDR